MPIEFQSCLFPQTPRDLEKCTACDEISGLFDGAGRRRADFEAEGGHNVGKRLPANVARGPDYMVSIASKVQAYCSSGFVSVPLIIPALA